jgi:hypothetical protein
MKVWSSFISFLKRKLVRTPPVKDPVRWEMAPFDFRTDWCLRLKELDGALSRASLARRRPVDVVPKRMRLCRLCDSAKSQENESSVVGLRPEP